MEWNWGENYERSPEPAVTRLIFVSAAVRRDVSEFAPVLAPFLAEKEFRVAIVPDGERDRVVGAEFGGVVCVASGFESAAAKLKEYRP